MNELAERKISGNKGGQAKQHNPVEAPDSLHSVVKARIMLALGEGEFAGPILDKDIFLDGTPLAGANGQRNFDGVTWDWRPGSVQQDPIPGVGEVASETSVNVELTTTQPWQRRVTNTQLDALRVRIGFPRMVTAESNGDSNGAIVRYQILLSTDDGPYRVYGDYVADGKTTSLYERSHLIMLGDALSHWDVRVVRNTPDSTSDLLANSTNIEAYSEVIFAKFRYPNTAHIFVEFNSKTFGSSIPKITVRTRMRRIQIPRNYDPFTRTYVGNWDGQFRMEWTDNPAWIFLDLVTNKRFGAGEHLTIDNINKWELYRISQYCDQMVPDGSGGLEPRHTCNVYIQSQAAAYTVLRDIANIFNGMVGYQNSEVIARADMPDDVVKVVSNASVINGQFDYAGGSVKDRYSVCLVQYSNPDNGYSDDTDMVRDLDLVRRYGVNTLNLTAIGCTRRGEAQRRGRWAMLSNSNDRTVSYSTGLEGLSYKAGQVVAVSDAFTSGHRLGGRIVSASGASVTLDAVPDGLGVGSVLYVNTGGGTAESRTVRSITGNKVLVNAAFITTPQPDEVWTIDSASFNGGQAITLQYFRIMSITNNEDGTFKVSGLWHSPEKYAAIDSGARIPKPHYSDIPGGVIAPPANVLMSSYTKVVQGLSVQTLHVSWDRVPGAVAYRAQWKRNSGDWINVPEGAALGFEVDGIYAGTYRARVCAVNSVDATSLWAEAVPQQLTGKDGEVPPLAAMTTAPLPWGIQVDFFYSPGSEDASYVELENSPNGTDTWQNLSNAPYPSTRYLHMGLKAGVTFWYRGRVVDKLGNKSAWSTPVRGDSSVNASDYLVEIAGDVLNSEDGRQLTTQIGNDIEGMLQTAAANDADVKRQWKQNGEFSAQVIQIATTVAEVDSAMADLTTLVQAQQGAIADNYAAIQQKMTAKFDYSGGTAIYSLQAGVNYQGNYYDAGFTLYVSAGSGQAPVTRIAFKADQFVMLSGSTPYSPFAIINGQVFINEAFIQEGTITMAKIAGALQSTNYVAGSTGWQLTKAGVFEINGNVPGQGRLNIQNNRIVAYDENNNPVAVMGQRL